MTHITPDWPVSSKVKALVTTRHGGVSLPPYDSFNLATHVGDDFDAVMRNRQLLKDSYQLPNEPIWLNQVHGCDLYHADQHHQLEEIPTADASMTRQSKQVLSVMTADCLPILITNRAETFVMAIHAGWRGLADGIIANTIAQSEENPRNLLAWIGPGIGKQAFEVGEDVYHIFMTQQPASAQDFSYLGKDEQGIDKYLLDTITVAKEQLQSLDVGWISGGDWCSYYDQENFFSYRRDGKTGRMASLIWLD